MHSLFLPALISLCIGILLIVILTTKYRVHAFFALIISCFVVGLGVQLPTGEIIASIKDGFGNIMKSIGLIIVFGTTLGVILEHTGSTRVMANYILKKVGEKRAPVAMSLTGFLVGLPIFCDSGYIVLSGLNNSLAKRTGIPVAVLAISLATGLYAIHCLIPPHPGASAAAGIFAVDFGRLILTGGIIAIPAAVVGHLWTNYAGKKDPAFLKENSGDKEITVPLPGVLYAFLPVLVPILLITIKSFLTIESSGTGWRSVFFLLGDPEIALAIGILLALTAKRSWKKIELGALLQDSAEKAGGILVIIGAGGAFGAVLAATHLGQQISTSLPLGSLGIFFPFLLTFVLKTAQGSSTVAIVTAASIVNPLLPSLGLSATNGPLLCVLSMGAGSMMISHANDAYFWVIAKFSGLDMKTMLRVYTVSTIFMGLTSFVLVWILSLILK
jgi:GntP family gluconate:H+ symporter